MRETTLTIRRVLVANRGEIAVRVIRACRELGLETVAIHSTVDEGAAHTRLADQAVCIGPAHPRMSYLHSDVVVQVALATGADAVHPGYGFLSENAAFAEACQENGLVFVGPNVDTISAIGDKVYARQLAASVGVPVIEGTPRESRGLSEIESLAATIGYPLLLKAAAGGGGRGMRLVPTADALRRSYAEASAEAEASFGNPTIYAERYIANARHVEVQVMGDHFGRAIHFGTRDCSVQRRHQKILEEAPATCVSDETRARVEQSAVELARHLRYVSAGTVEFLVDAGTDRHYFIEMNTRIQVEHPVTEMVTGHDLVREQLRVADGTVGLSLEQRDVSLRGHAIELRINAEDPERGFAPCPGLVEELMPPGGAGVRWDSHLCPGQEISPYYDSMVAKLVIHDTSREEARRRALRAVDELTISGVKTNAPFLRWVLSHPDYRENRLSTTWVEESFDGSQLKTTA